MEREKGDEKDERREVKEKGKGNKNDSDRGKRKRNGEGHKDRGMVPYFTSCCM